VRLERTLPSVWVLRAAEVPALAGGARDRVLLVEDVETLCASIVADQDKRSAGGLEMCDLYESVGYLLGQVVELLPTYDPTRGRQVHDPYDGGFKGWLHLELTRDLIDHWRSWFGRAKQKRVFDPRPFLRQEEAEVGQRLDALDPVEDAGEARERGLDGTVVGVTHDGPDDRFDAFGWALDRRDREAARKVEAVGLGSTTPLAQRDRVPDREELAA
jgi:hypothetical protein